MDKINNICKWYYSSNQGKDLSLEHKKVMYDRNFVELSKCSICGKTIVSIDFLKANPEESKAIKMLWNDENFYQIINEKGEKL